MLIKTLSREDALRKFFDGATNLMFGTVSEMQYAPLWQMRDADVVFYERVEEETAEPVVPSEPETLPPVSADDLKATVTKDVDAVTADCTVNTELDTEPETADGWKAVKVNIAPKKAGRKLTYNPDDMLRMLADEDMTAQDVANFFSVSLSTVNSFKQHHKAEIEERMRQVEDAKATAAKLTGLA